MAGIDIREAAVETEMFREKHSNYYDSLCATATGLVKAFQKSAQGFSVYAKDQEYGDHWRDWVKAHASVFWIFRGAPQDPSGMKEDHERARKYLGFLIADDILDKCQAGQSCPTDILVDEHVEYLQNLNIHEFVCLKAYLNYLKREETGGSSHCSDYFEALDRMDQAFASWLTRSCAAANTCFDNRPLLEKAAADARNHFENRLRGRGGHWPGVAAAVSEYHQWFEERARSASLKPLEVIYGESQVTTMLELLVLCPIVRSMKRSAAPP